MTTYSFSQISTYLQCPRKYQYRYLDKVKVKEFETTYELILGSLVHQALEWWYQHLTNSPQNSLFPPQIPTKQELLTYFAHHREKEIRNQRAIREPSYFTPEDIRRRAETYLSTYYDQHSDFSDIIAVETEKSILFTLPNGQSFKGIIDRLDHLKDGTLVINDYKTGKKLPVEIENQYISQLSLYAYGLQQQF
jgi:RecB family exonuclease